MKNLLKGLIVSVFFALAVLPKICFGITASELKVIQDQGDKITIIDIRRSSDYVDGHIPDAINIPARILGVKRLPELGRVIVYGEGINKREVLDAVIALNKKDGIHAEVLEGGLDSWNALKFMNTSNMGIKKEIFRYITYRELEKVSKVNGDIVLVDMRSSGINRNQSMSDSPPVSVKGKLSLSEKFPGLEIITLQTRNAVSNRRGGDVSITNLTKLNKHRSNITYVLIDNGFGSADAVARRLHVSGINQVAILIGGDTVLQSEGQSGTKTLELGY